MQTTDRIRCATLALGVAAVALSATGAVAQNGISREKFVESIKLGNLKAHLKALNTIGRQNGDTRAAGTPGYQASGDYVRQQLEEAGYTPVVQPFAYTQYIEIRPSELKSRDGSVEYVPYEDITSMQYSGNGRATGRIVPADGIVVPATPDPSSASGCSPDDFAASTAGNIALIQRGGCNFIVKVQNAVAAGAVGAIIFNEGNANFPDRIPLFGGTLGEQVSIPVLSASYEVGTELLEATGRYTLRVQAEFRETTTFNIIADTPRGTRDETIVVGAHLDSVPEGLGINDNGSGTAAILEIARQMGTRNVKNVNRVRFAFWGGEEDGLLGSTYYVGTLKRDQLEKIALNLNFDMLGSQNFVRFVYDGNNNGGVGGDLGPEGSAQIERIFLRYFARQNLETAPTAFDGRSDYGPFIEVGIPAGGLFSGAEGIKTQAEEDIFGGEAGVAYDECYHQACDTIDNINDEGLLQLSRAAADSTFYWATQTDLFAPQAAARAQIAATADGFDYRGPRLKR